MTLALSDNRRGLRSRATPPVPQRVRARVSMASPTRQAARPGLRVGVDLDFWSLYHCRHARPPHAALGV
ncbi:hypothetical protein QRD43_11500 [Pelomonas sp. APW6]|uniref:Uncharacterized protein n=1 Tax=Roseateles subflavus TaxID=3053353 RepID=A0ABT7LI35_9BURK|nr:hypothetical protein [Pelomonas sp. APW6]MDL5032528.1 hypothetical protein [Pelomonas sp. APW6]